MGSGTVFNIQRFSIHDGPGIRTTVFFKGCPLRCWWCHNPEGESSTRELLVRAERCIGCGACLRACVNGAIVEANGSLHPITENCVLCGACADVCPTEAREIAGREMTVAQVMAEIERDRLFYDQSGGGVTFSGGEPLAQPMFLEALLQACSEREIHTAVDTSGFASPQVLRRVAVSTDLFLYDLKLIDDERHRHYTGVSNALILQNLRELAQGSQAIVIRVPIIPEVNDDAEGIGQLGSFIASLACPPPVELLAYHRIALEKYKRLQRAYGLPETEPPSTGRMVEIAEMLRRFGLHVIVGG